MKLKLLAAAAISALALSANAATTDWGAHADLELAAALVDPGAFSDTITFSIPGTSDISSTTVANNLLSLANITGGMVSLYREAGATDALLGSYSFDGTTGSTWHTTTGLTAGSYYYQITGNATGTHGGFYSITSTVTPVPEPETYAMLLAGLGVVGSLYRRRKSS
ncbi:FxDxF family PEP-CTERM protein [Ideonella sp. BN130291]|uniref:FxDxF family PEP-CTERM protein n=1 Tax=Ideonella sp. BN130291 TaxID=3112940 RepID=UPI002E263DAC|nr:FxDxF family PEP-CTERM protein [Ideonella sp. BN130291]